MSSIVHISNGEFDTRSYSPYSLSHLTTEADEIRHSSTPPIQYHGQCHVHEYNTTGNTMSKPMRQARYTFSPTAKYLRAVPRWDRPQYPPLNRNLRSRARLSSSHHVGGGRTTERSIIVFTDEFHTCEARGGSPCGGTSRVQSPSWRVG
jgi:hypothetical protein